MGEDGLVVVGVSDEGMGLIEKHIGRVGMEFPVARIKPEVDRWYGVTGFPSAALVGADGRVKWMGHPGTLEHRVIQEALDECWFVPEIPGDDHGAINKELARRDYGKAHALASKEEENPLAVKTREAIEKLCEEMWSEAEASRAEDPARAYAMCDEIRELFDGLPRADEAKALQKELTSDKAAKREISADQMLRKAEAVAAKGDFEKAASKYRAILRKYEDTKAGAEAKAFFDRHVKLK